MIPDINTVKLNRLEMAYYDQSPEQMVGTILLVHGFASTARVNWITTGWMKKLLDHGFRVVAVDNRGHGQSQKFYSPDDYGPDIFTADLLELMDYLELSSPDVMGYSMGARITTWLAAHHPKRVNKIILGGMGAHIFGQRRDYEPIASALETDDIESITDTDGLLFRKFADNTKSDRLALAACIRPSKVRITPDTVANVKCPTLIAVGSNDDVAGSPDELANMMPNSIAFTIPNLDHMKATGAEPYKQKVLEFLS